jgi:hypothetical protein
MESINNLTGTGLTEFKMQMVAPRVDAKKEVREISSDLASTLEASRISCEFQISLINQANEEALAEIRAEHQRESHLRYLAKKEKYAKLGIHF